MNVDPVKIKVSEIFEGYFNDDEEGVTAYNDRLDIRPKYQREWVYNDAQRDEVIRTVLKGFPLNIFYWVKNGEDSYEMLDGQQRTMSLMEYMEGNFTVDDMLYDNLPQDKQDIIKNYELTVYICEGTESEKLDWFKIINVAGEELTDQELRNAVYSGSWTSDAKRYFSKTGCAAYRLASDYIANNLAPIRQEYLELALSWIADRDGETIETYMAKHQHDQDAKELWDYFQDVIEWVEETFPKYRSLMKGLPWGLWYNKYHDRTDLDAQQLEARIVELIQDDEVTKQKGIYAYLLTGEEKHLSLRVFDDREKRQKYEEQNHKCAICGKECKYEDMHGDHYKAWSEGGKTVYDNLQMLCTTCNIMKSNQRA